MIAGDFQIEPLHCPSLANASSFFGWTDPLTTTEGNETFRPSTFSLDKAFSGPGDNTSSIDGFFLNRVAACALTKISVLSTFDTQHRPIEACFNWLSIVQEGYFHLKTSPLDLSEIDKPITHSKQQEVLDSESLWNERFAADFEQCNVETKWEKIIQFCVEVLLRKGAKWSGTLQERGKPPMFVKKQVYPGQLPSGSTKTHRLHQSYKTKRRLQELFYRLQRISCSPADWHITRTTGRKARIALNNMNAPAIWHEHQIPNLMQIQLNLDWLTALVEQMESHRKTHRIRKWKEKIKCSTTGTHSYIFEHLKQKNIHEPPNLVTTADGTILFQPQDAITEINNQRDEVFSANLLHETPMKMLEIVWPYIKHDYQESVVPELQASHLIHVIQDRKQFAAGLDGWRTMELKSLPCEAFTPIAEFFRAMEASSDPLPQSLTCCKQMILNKNGHSAPMQKRLISVMPALMLAYTGARYRHLADWQTNTMPLQIMGGIKGRQMTSVATDLRLHMDMAHHEEDALIGIKLDKSKCFDRVIPSYAAALFLAFGVDKRITCIFVKIYQGLRRHLFYKNWAADKATTPANGVAQGCSLSLIAVNVYTKVWVCMMKNLPQIAVKAYVDDAYLWTKLTNSALLSDALQATILWDSIAGQLLNESKSVVWATSKEARNVAKKVFPQMTLQLEFEVLGTMLYTTQRSAYAYSEDAIFKILADTRNIAALAIPTQLKCKQNTDQ